MHAGRSPAASEIIATNIAGSVTLLDTCRDLGVDAFVNVGDAFEYGPGGGARTETSACRPSSLEGVAKLATTLYGNALATTTDLPVVTIRPFSIVGRDDDPLRLVPRLVATAREGSPIKLSDRRVNRDFVAVDDVVELLGRVADRAAVRPRPGVQLRPRRGHDPGRGGRGRRARRRDGRSTASGGRSRSPNTTSSIRLPMPPRPRASWAGARRDRSRR